MIKFERGKRYKVSFEAEAMNTEEFYWSASDGRVTHFHLEDFPADATFEKLPDPVVTFEPGDRVKSRGNGWEYTVGVNGYFCHNTNQIYESHYRFQSDQYHKVG